MDSTGVGRASLSCVDIDFLGGTLFNPLTVQLLYITIMNNRVKLITKYDEYIYIYYSRIKFSRISRDNFSQMKIFLSE